VACDLYYIIDQQRCQHRVGIIQVGRNYNSLEITPTKD
jgi:hypothetical protein